MIEHLREYIRPLNCCWCQKRTTVRAIITRLELKLHIWMSSYHIFNIRRTRDERSWNCMGKALDGYHIHDESPDTPQISLMFLPVQSCGEFTAGFDRFAIGAECHFNFECRKDRCGGQPQGGMRHYASRAFDRCQFLAKFTPDHTSPTMHVFQSQRQRPQGPGWSG